MKSATQTLREEHESILRMLDVLEMIAHLMEAGEPVPVRFLDDLQEFFVLFADRSHHAKEEAVLFPALEQKGLPRVGGPLGCLISEHREGRTFVKAMAKAAEALAAGDRAAAMVWAQAARGYADLLRNHIRKENEVLFKIADEVLTADKQFALTEAFANVQEERLGRKTQSRVCQEMDEVARHLPSASSLVH